jgi:signal transduction histidine kinase
VVARNETDSFPYADIAYLLGTNPASAMRMAFSLLLLCFYLPLWAQDTFAIRINQIPAEGILLDKGWKFQAGDSPAFALPEHDDSKWQPINPTWNLHQLPQIEKSGIGWLRLHLKIDSTLTDNMLAVIASSFGASEIYLNGQLVLNFGIVSPDYKEEKLSFFFDRPFNIKLSKQAVQVLAVRYSFNPKNLYLKFVQVPPVMKLVLQDAEKGFANYTKGEGLLVMLRPFQLSFYLPVGLLLLAIFHSFRSQRHYLHFGIFCLCLFLGMLLQLWALLESTPGEQSVYMVLAAFVFWTMGLLLLINGTYSLYGMAKKWNYRTIIIYAVLVLPSLFLTYNWGGIIFSCFILIAFIEYLRLNTLAMLKRRPGAWILFTAGLMQIALIIIMIGFATTEKTHSYFVLSSVLYIVPAVGLSLFTAAEFARNGLSLQRRVKEVEHLSRKTLEQEKEKQQLLAVQNEVLEKQVAERTAELTNSLHELKTTQAQLIQKEKMASLGELTAGIAHEIQNPLNFVNNFSETNAELIQEAKIEFKTGNNEEGLAILDDVEANEQKITVHGRRAEAIVKNMLEHSRSSKGEKQSTDLNSLIDEYLRLSYHGFRAKDKSFNATVKTDFAEGIEKVNIVPQEIGRVLLNLFNNAFYTVNEKKKNAVESYEPVVSAISRKLNDKIEIAVKDNGTGISQAALTKVFQPFFTTKPTGQGTGLGLSLSYDIVKAHGGELKVESIEGDGATLTILLPLT